MIEVLSASALATVQDLGRIGTLQWGVGTSGAMDPLALASGNLLLGNDEGAAAIEVPVFPFEVRFTEDCAFALTGADCTARLDGMPLLPWWAHQARAGQTLQLGPPQLGRWRASRAYLCLPGGVDVPKVLGSRSTQLRGAFGGHEGRALRQGDRLRADGNHRAQTGTGFGLVPPALALPLEVDGVAAMRVLPAAEYPLHLGIAAGVLARRMEDHRAERPLRLSAQGTPLEPRAAIEMRSHGIVPGVIQVPSGGQPIVQMRDAQPSGGYPKIGTVIEADLWRLGQAPIGSRIRFVETSWEEAVAALEQTRRWLDQVRRLVDLQRG
jgi:biotin-dependent carboxylase-like uncharacterized protein